MTANGPTPEDLETLAAFIDQRLPTEERTAFMARLDREEGLYEVFVETVRAADEEVGERERAEVVQGPWGWRVWASAAAAVAAALTLVVVIVGNRVPDYPQSLVADLGMEGHLEAGWFQQDWSVQRGSEPTSDEVSAAFKLGVRAIDLEVALLAGLRDDSIALTGQHEALLQTIEFMDPLSFAYADIGRRLEDGEDPGDLVQLAQDTRATLTSFLQDLEPAYELGMWTETGRLAAVSANLTLLEARSYRQALKKRRVWLDLSPEANRHLRLLNQLLERPIEESDLKRLEEAFSSLAGAVG